MIRKQFQFYSYLFQEEEGITASYFQTDTGTEYRVYFYPLHEYFDMLAPDTQLYNCGYFFGFTKLAPNEGKIEPLDFRIRNTILVILKDFFEEKGSNKVLMFYCDDDDGKKSKRSLCFDLWYRIAENGASFYKYDEEISVLSESGEKADTNYLSLIVARDHPNLESLLNEFQRLKEKLISNK